MMLVSEGAEKNGSETEEVDERIHSEDSNAGINVLTTKKSIHQAKQTCPKEVKDDHEEDDEILEEENEV